MKKLTHDYFETLDDKLFKHKKRLAKLEDKLNKSCVIRVKDEESDALSITSDIL